MYYEPTEKQLEFHNCMRRHILFGGAVGPGKSAALCNAVVAFCTQFKCDFFFGRVTYNDFMKTTERELEKWLDEGLVDNWNRSKHQIRFVDCGGYNKRQLGSLLIMGGANDPNTLNAFTLGGFALDEASGIPKAAFNMLCSRLREPSMDEKDYVAWLATNPCQGWVKKLFYDMPERRPECPHEPDFFKKPAEENYCSKCKYGGCKAGKNIQFIPALPEDNPYLPGSYVSSLKSMYPPEWVKMLVEGDWDVQEGQVFTEFSDAKHVTQHMVIPSDWTRYMGIDPHPRTATHVLWMAVDPRGHKWVYRELAHSGTVEQISKEILAMEKGEVITVRLIDTSADVDDHLTNLNIMTEFSKHGVHCTPCKKGNQVGLARMKQSLSQNNITFLESCPISIDQIKSCIWDSLISKVASERRDEPQWWGKKNDHMLDIWKYLEIFGPEYVSNLEWSSVFNSIERR